MVFNIEGVLAPVFTPMDGAGEINPYVIPKYIAYLHRNNVRGILVGGTTGEAALLSLAERKSLLKDWIAAAEPLGIKVISQVGAAPIPDVISLAKYSEEVGADAIMTLPELYYKPKTVEQLVSYLKSVSDAAPSLPLIFYHFPMMSGVDLNMKQFVSMATSKIPNFKGMKADLGVAVQIADQLSADQRVFIANHHLAPAALMGYDCSIATVTNLLPSLVFEIVDSVNKDVYTAQKKQKEMNRIVDVIASQGDFVPSMKAAMELLTCVEVGPPRQPLTPLSKEQVSNLNEQLSKLLPDCFIVHPKDIIEIHK